MRTTLFAAVFSVLVTMPAAAQQVLVSFEPGGRVTVEATAATVRSILNEWSAKGGTKVLGAEKIAGAPVTLKLVNVPESLALETILRSVAGYMAAPRPMATGPSMYDRILIMATTTAPAQTANRAVPTNNNNPMNGTQRFIPPRIRDEQREADEQEEPDENPPNPPVFTFPQPGQQNGNPGVNQPGMFQNAPPFNQQPNVVINPANPNAPSPAPYQPGMPIGVATPGMMVPPPQQQQQPPVPPGMIRRPGGNQ